LIRAATEPAALLQPDDFPIIKSLADPHTEGWRIAFSRAVKFSTAT
jgi:hypothetical protein